MSPSATPQGSRAMVTVRSLSDPVASMSSIDSLVSLLAIAYRAEVPHTCGQGERLVHLMHTMSLPPLKRNREEYLSSFLHFLSPVLNGMAGMEDFAVVVKGFTQPEDFRDFWSFEGRNLIKEVTGSNAPLRALRPSVTRFVDEFVQDDTRKIALGSDNSGLFLVSGNAEVGDELLLHGLLVDGDGPQASVRRVLPDGTWITIGEAFTCRQ